MRIRAGKYYGYTEAWKRNHVDIGLVSTAISHAEVLHSYLDLKANQNSTTL